jgi:hypothetical protein
MELTSENWKTELLATSRNPQTSYLIFISGLPRSRVAFDIAEYLESRENLTFPNVSLVLHNGDYFPESNRIAAMSNKFKFIYSVNWMGSAPNVRAIPIGLENQGYLRNGVLNDYLRLLPKLAPLPERPIKLLAAFSNHTNTLERERAKSFAKEMDGAVVLDSSVTPKKYRELMSKSVYVLSPPGNGIDCHRTWEALFLGCIPVVKKDAWPFLHQNLNVVVLENWYDLTNLSLPSEISTSNFVNDFGKVEKWLNP